MQYIYQCKELPFIINYSKPTCSYSCGQGNNEILQALNETVSSDFDNDGSDVNVDEEREDENLSNTYMEQRESEFLDLKTAALLIMTSLCYIEAPMLEKTKRFFYKQNRLLLDVLDKETELLIYEE